MSRQWEPYFGTERRQCSTKGCGSFGIPAVFSDSGNLCKGCAMTSRIRAVREAARKVLAADKQEVSVIPIADLIKELVARKGEISSGLFDEEESRIKAQIEVLQGELREVVALKKMLGGGIRKGKKPGPRTTLEPYIPQILELKRQGLADKKIASQLQIGYSSVYRTVKKFQEEGKL